jgi:hypothetical protein
MRLVQTRFGAIHHALSEGVRVNFDSEYARICAFTKEDFAELMKPTFKQESRRREEYEGTDEEDLPDDRPGRLSMDTPGALSNITERATSKLTKGKSRHHPRKQAAC